MSESRRLLQTVETARCTGQCCKEFPLSYGPEELRERCKPRPALDILRISKPTFLDMAPIQDGEIIADMVIYLGWRRWKLADINDEMKAQPKMHFYTCKHLQDDGNCGIYDKRPRMCRDYPEYGRDGFCGHTTCTRTTLADGEEGQGLIAKEAASE